MLLFITSAVFAMEQPIEEINHFDWLPLETKKEIFAQLGNQENPATRYENFKELMRCKRVCKQWIPIVEAMYTILLNHEKKRIERKEAEWCADWKQRDHADELFFSCALESDSCLYIYEYFKDKPKKINNPLPYAFIGDEKKYWYNSAFNQDTPLIKCVHLGSINVIKILIGFGADLHKKDRDGKAAIQIAIEQNKTEIAKQLIERGAELEYLRFGWDGDLDRDWFSSIKTAQNRNNNELVRFIDEFTKSKRHKR